MTRSIVLLAALVAFSAGCASQYRGDVSYDPDALHRGYKTFAWVEGQGQGSDPVRAIGEKAVEAELVKDGLSLSADASQADLLTRINWGRRKRAATSGALTGNTPAVGMEVILIDRKTGHYVWNGWASKTWSSDLDAEVEVPAALAVIFAHFPPTE